MPNELKKKLTQFDTIELASDKRATLLAPSINKDQKLCIIDETVLKYLSSLVPEGTMDEILDRFRQKMENIENTKGWVALLTLELNFHAGVNMIGVYYKEEEDRIAEAIEAEQRRKARPAPESMRVVTRDDDGVNYQNDLESVDDTERMEREVSSLQYTEKPDLNL